VLSSTRIDQLKLGVGGLNLSLNFFPVDLKLLILSKSSLEIHNNRVGEVSLSKDDLASLLVVFINTFIFLLRGLLFSFALALFAFNLLREGFVASSPDLKLVRGDLNFIGVSASSSDITCCNLKLLDLVAVEEVSDVNPALLVSLNLLSEELVSS